VTDDEQGESTGLAEIELAPVNDPPVARPDEFRGLEDTDLVVDFADILKNDTDVDGDELSILSFGTPSSGSFTTDGDTLTYTPDLNFAGEATMTYLVTDGTDGEDTGVITFAITSTNRAPIAPQIRVSGTEDVPFSMTIADLMAQVSDPDPEDTLEFISVGDAEFGNAFETQNGLLQFAPVEHVNGDVVYSYRISDGRLSTTGEFVVHYAAVNDAPLAVDDTGFVVNEDQPLSIDFAALTANDLDVEGDAFSVVEVFDGDNGDVVAVGETAVFTPRHDYFGNAKFKYIVEDVHGARAVGEAFITVLPVDDVPVIVADAPLELNEDGETIIDANLFLANDIDPDNGVLTLEGLSGPHLEDLGAGLYRFAPDANANGTYQLSYTVANQYGVTASGSVDINVLPVPDAPEAQGDFLRSFEDLTFSILQSDLLANDLDADGDALTVTDVTSGEDVAVTLEDDGTIRIAPSADFNGMTSFAYTVEDPDGLSSTATVDVEILPVNDAPVTTPDSFDGGDAETVTIPTDDLLANDTDADGDTLSVSSVSSGPGYSAALDGAGNIVVSRDPEFEGTLDVGYTVSDGTTEVESSVAVALTPSNRAPELDAPDEVSTEEDSDFSITLPSDVASDPDGDDVTLDVTRAGGLELPDWLTFDAQSRTLSGRPPENFNGTLELELSASDGELTTTAPLRFVVAPANDIPVIMAPLSDRNTLEDRAFDIQLQKGLFADVDGDDLIFELALSDGSALPDWLNFDAERVAISGTPPDDFYGDIGLRLSASDGQATVSDEFVLSVTPEDDAPVLATPLPDYTTGDDGEVLTTGVPFDITLPEDTFVDPDGDELSYAARLSDGSPLPDWLSFDGTSLSGTAPRSDAGTLEIELFATDGRSEVSDTFAMTLAQGNAAPDARDDSFDVDVPNTLRLESADLLANDLDLDGDDLTITAVSSAANGQVSFENGVIEYLADFEFSGQDTFTYTVSDGQESDTATVTVDVNNRFDDVERGGSGTDFSFGGRGDDLFLGGAGNDIGFGGRGEDFLDGGSGNDFLSGGRGNDTILSGSGNDLVFGGRGDDVISGGTGNDRLFGGSGSDTFEFSTGDGSDIIFDFDVSRAQRRSFIPGDELRLNVEGIEDYDDLMGAATQTWFGVLFDFGDGDEIFLLGTRLAALDEDQFTFY
ncbi:MAG: tandem-95 repeat protein, partial [Roseovarius sp.]